MLSALCTLWWSLPTSVDSASMHIAHATQMQSVSYCALCIIFKNINGFPEHICRWKDFDCTAFDCTTLACNEKLFNSLCPIGHFALCSAILHSVWLVHFALFALFACSHLQANGLATSQHCWVWHWLVQMLGLARGRSRTKHETGKSSHQVAPPSVPSSKYRIREIMHTCVYKGRDLGEESTYWNMVVMAETIWAPILVKCEGLKKGQSARKDML